MQVLGTSPEPRAGHCVGAHEGAMVLYGGVGGRGETYFGDAWLLHVGPDEDRRLGPHQAAWTRLHPRSVVHSIAQWISLPSLSMPRSDAARFLSKLRLLCLRCPFHALQLHAEHDTKCVVVLHKCQLGCDPDVVTQPLLRFGLASSARQQMVLRQRQHLLTCRRHRIVAV